MLFEFLQPSMGVIRYRVCSPSMGLIRYRVFSPSMGVIRYRVRSPSMGVIRYRVCSPSMGVIGFDWYSFWPFAQIDIVKYSTLKRFDKNLLLRPKEILKLSQTFHPKYNFQEKLRNIYIYIFPHNILKIMSKFHNTEESITSIINYVTIYFVFRANVDNKQTKVGLIESSICMRYIYIYFRFYILFPILYIFIICIVFQFSCMIVIYLEVISFWFWNENGMSLSGHGT